MLQLAVNASKRLFFLDFFRGLIMFLLIAEAADFHHNFTELSEGIAFSGLVYQRHYHLWNGLRFWDLIQPFFVFIVGITMPFSLRKQQAYGSRRAATKQILKNNSNFKYLIFVFFLVFGFYFANAQEEEWRTIFNEKNLDGWTTKIHHYEVGDNYGDTFRVEDSIIKVRYDKYEGGFNDRFSHLYFDEPYSYFHLSMEYRFVGEPHPGAPVFIVQNSGVMFHSQDPRTMLKEQNWPISVEMQFLGGIEKGQERPTGNMCSPGTDVEYQGKIDPRHCISSSSKTYFGDQWVKAELIVRGDSLVTHVINGKTVLEYTKPRVGGEVVKGHDPKMKPDGQLLKEGFIALQSEGQPIDFRNIKIKNLKGCMDPKASNYKTFYIKSDDDACIY